MAIERKSYQYFQQLTTEEFEAMSTLEQNAHRRRFFELELTQEDVAKHIAKLERRAESVRACLRACVRAHPLTAHSFLSAPC